MRRWCTAIFATTLSLGAGCVRSGFDSWSGGDAAEAGPSVSIEQASAQRDPTSFGPILFDISFSAPIDVASLTVDDLVNRGSATVTLWHLEAVDGQRFVLQALEIDGEGSVAPTLPVGAAQDPQGRASLASSGRDGSVLFRGFGIVGATADLDETPDSFLTDRANPILHWRDAAGETEYEISLFQDDQASRVCDIGRAPADSTRVSLAGCALDPLTLYYAVARASNGERVAEARNNPFPLFTGAPVEHRVTFATAPDLLVVPAGVRFVQLEAFGAGGGREHDRASYYGGGGGGASYVTLEGNERLLALGAGGGGAGYGEGDGFGGGGGYGALRLATAGGEVLKLVVGEGGYGPCAGGQGGGPMGGAAGNPAEASRFGGGGGDTWGGDGGGGASAFGGGGGGGNSAGQPGGDSTFGGAGGSAFGSCGRSLFGGACAGAHGGGGAGLGDLVLLGAAGDDSGGGAAAKDGPGRGGGTCAGKGGDGLVVVSYPGPPGPFSILGVTGGADSTADAFLEDGLVPTVHWSNPSGEVDLALGVYASFGGGPLCQATSIPPDVTELSPSGCTLSPGATYRIRLSATNLLGSTPASNDDLAFRVGSPTAQHFQDVGNYSFNVPGGVGLLQVEAFGAGGSHDRPTQSYESGGGGGSSYVQRDSDGTLVAVGGGGGGGGYTGEGRGGGGGGGYARSVLLVSPGEQFTVVVGEGGYGACIGGQGGGPGGGAMANPGGESVFGGGGGDAWAGADSHGGDSKYGGGGGGNRHARGGHSVYGGAGGHHQGKCGESVHGAACKAAGGGGGGGLGQVTAYGDAGSEGAGGAAAMGGPGVGSSDCELRGGDGRVVVSW